MLWFFWQLIVYLFIYWLIMQDETERRSYKRKINMLIVGFILLIMCLIVMAIALGVVFGIENSDGLLGFNYA